MTLVRIHAADLTLDHMKWLRAITSLGDRGYEPAHLIQDEILGARQFFDIQHPEGRGIVVTEVIGHPAGRELYVWGTAGENAPKVTGDVVKALRETARLWNCNWLGWRASREGMVRLYKKYADISPEGKYFSVEV